MKFAVGVLFVCLSVSAFSINTASIYQLESKGLYSKVITICDSDDSAMALCIQGDYLYHGRKGVSVDKDRGMELYKKALALLLIDAESGNADAQYWVARCQEYGARNLKEAREWYFKSADAGSPKAMFKAAWFAANRLGIEGMAFDEARKLAIRYAKAASEAGNADGTALLAWLKFIDCNAMRDFESALPMIRTAADENSLLGKTMLGRMYIDGTGVKKDLAKAEQLLLEAVDQGYSEALDSLKEVQRARGKNKSAMKNDAREDADKLSWSKLTPEEKAKRGAELYESPDTRKEGVSLLRQAAGEGSAFALARLSALYYLGEGGFRQDYGMALRLMKSSVAKGFPAEQLPIKEVEEACKRDNGSGRKHASDVRPGYGYPGRLEAYTVGPELRQRLDQFHLTAGWFRRDDLAEGMIKPYHAKELLANEIPYLLFAPAKGRGPVPMVVYFGGTGEQGTDLIAHFRQTTIFSIVTSPEFQKKHPCYLFAPLLPKDSYIRCEKGFAPPMADLVCDAMFAVIKAAKNPKVDTSRLYLTGLSYGGSAAWTFSFGYPGRFAASLPVAGYASERSVPDEKPGNIWLLYNENEYSSEVARRELADVARAIAERGGEFRSSAFPDKGHNAWDKAWREDAVWEWMFSKRVDDMSGRKSRGSAAAASAGKRTPVFLEGVVCSASKPGRDDATGPERAVDGLDATCYVSAEPFMRGDWWCVEFSQPVSGRITVKSGYRDGSCRVVSAKVETSSDGRRWSVAGRFRRNNGECTFAPRSSIKHLRVVSDSQTGETLVLREVVVK